MKIILRSAALFCTILGLSAGFVAAPSFAATTHKHHSTHHHAHKKGHAGLMVKTAQQHLQHLGYYQGSVDGLLGPKTKTAIKNFQHDHHFKVTGTLSTSTYNAIIAADVIAPKPTIPEPIITSAPPTFPNNTTSIQTRYGQINIKEDDHGTLRDFEVAPNGQRLFVVPNQPSPMDTSPVYQLNNEDVVIFSTYRPNSPLCVYKSYLLITNATDSKLLEIDNCTRDYHAEVNDGSLFITYPESDDGRPVGSTWRYEDGHLERL